MKKSLPLIVAIIGCCPLALAQTPPSGARAAKPAAEAPTYTAPPKPPGLMKRIFGSRLDQRPAYPAQPEPENFPPAPADAPKRRVLFPPKVEPVPQIPEPETSIPESKPKPKKRKPISTTAPKKKSSPAREATKVDAPESTPPAPEKAPVTDPAVTPAVTDPVVTPEAPVAVKKPVKGKKPPVVAATKPPEPAPAGDLEANEKARFDEAKAKAEADPEVADLKSKAVAAVTDEEAKGAQRAYNTALFKKMREIDTTIEERINAMEAAVLKRLDEQ